MKLYEVMSLPYGKERRLALINWMNDQGPDFELEINGIHRVNDKDPDIQYMMKKGILCRGKKAVKTVSKYSRPCTYSTLRISPVYNNQ